MLLFPADDSVRGEDDVDLLKDVLSDVQLMQATQRFLSRDVSALQPSDKPSLCVFEVGTVEECRHLHSSAAWHAGGRCMGCCMRTLHALVFPMHCHAGRGGHM